MAAMALSHPARLKASMSSSQVTPRKALYFSGRLIVIHAAELRTSYAMSSYCMINSSSVHRQAAGNADDLTRHETRVVAGQEGDQSRNVVRLPQTFERDRLPQALVHLLPELAIAEERMQQRRVGRAGTHDIDPDVVARIFPSDRLRERDQPALARGIHRLARGSDAACIGGDVDDRPAPSSDHVRKNSLVQVKRAAQVDGDDLV